MHNTLTCINDQTYVIEGRNTYFRVKTQPQPLKDSHYEQHPDYTLAITGCRTPFFNVVLQHKAHLPHSSEMKTILQIFQSKHIPFVWWESPLIKSNVPFHQSTDNPLYVYGLQYAGLFTGVCADLQSQPTSVLLPEGINIKIAQGDADIRIFSELITTIFEIDPSLNDEFYAIYKTAPSEGIETHFIAYKQNTPIGVITLMRTSQNAGLWNFGVLPEYRRQGIGSSLIQAACMEARRSNHTKIMAVLMTPFLSNLWMNFGFIDCCYFPFYLQQGT